MRCNGSGKYDRGVCFGCRGVGFKNQSTKPRALKKFALTVEYEGGSTNSVVLFANTKKLAISILELNLRIKGWRGAVKG